jgi:SAM-dependent methyltransferase
VQVIHLSGRSGPNHKVVFPAGPIERLFLTDGQSTLSSAANIGPQVARRAAMDTIYDRPLDYDLEHEGDDQDVGFYLDLVKRLRPRRVLELASGSGRVTLPLARLAATLDCEIVGLEIAESMLTIARRKQASLDYAAARRIEFVQGDLRTWRSHAPFDLIITPCSSLSHLLTVDEQLAAWTNARRNLADGGRFVVDLAMPNLTVYAESMQTPPRTTVEIDVDAFDAVSGARLLRYKTTRYMADEQRAQIRFLYDKFPDGAPPDRYISDFDCHVYFPREVELLFRISGFEIEARYGDYEGRRFRPASRQQIVVGRIAAP